LTAEALAKAVDEGGTSGFSAKGGPASGGHPDKHIR